MAFTGQDATIQIELGETYDGTTPSFSGAINYTGIATRFRIHEELAKVDVTGTARVRRNRPTVLSGDCEFDKFVTLAGSLVMRATPRLVGRWIRITVIEYSSLGQPAVFFGVIMEGEWTFEEDKPQMEKIKVDLSIDINS